MTNLIVLITGASGFIGTRLAKFLTTRCHVVGTYLTNKLVRVQSVEYHLLDVVDQHATWDLVQSVEPDIVVHIAGTKDINFCEKHPQQAWLVHAQGTQNVVRACIDVQARIVYISTDCVFNGKKELYTEDDCTDPFNVYGQVKHEGEKIMLTCGLSTAVIRASLLFGWRLPGQASNTVMDVIKYVENHQRIDLPTTLFNTPLFIYDAVQAIGNVALSSLEGVFHLAGKDRISRYDLAVATATTFDLDVGLVSPIEATTGFRPENSCLDSSRLGQTLATRFCGITEGLARMRSEPRVPKGISILGRDDEDEYYSRSL